MSIKVGATQVETALGAAQFEAVFFHLREAGGAET
jgi:hypothetical protein